jgi:hypothetical protein
MGSYSNPEQVKDYSNEIVNAWSKAAENVTGGLIKYGEAKQSEYNSKIEKFKENIIINNKLKQSYYNNMATMVVGYGGADLKETFNGTVDEYAAISLRLANGTSDDPPRDMAELADIDALIGKTKKHIETLMSYQPEHKKKLALNNNVGGYDATQSTDIINSFSALYGDAPGNKTIRIVKDANGKRTVKFGFSGVDKDGNKTWPEGKDDEVVFDGDTIDKMNDNGDSLMPSIPNPETDLAEITKGDLYKKVPVTRNGVVTAESAHPLDKYYDYKETDQGDAVGGLVKTYMAGTLNPGRFEEGLLKSPEFLAQAKAYFATPQKAAALLNSVLHKEGDGIVTAEQIVKDGAIDPKTKKASNTLQAKFNEKLAKYWANSQPKNIKQTDETGQEITSTRKETEEESVYSQIKIHQKGKEWKTGETQRVILMPGGKSKITYFRDPKSKPKIESILP